MRSLLKPLALAGLVFLAGAAPAFAHLSPEEHGSFMAGFSHPLFGLDHILAMVAVGLWAAMIGGRAVTLVPLSFVGTMTLGFLLAFTGIALPFVEPAILASVIALGLLLATAVKLPTEIGMIVVGTFALFHGFAHGGEIGAATHLEYGLGFAAATSLLHIVGIGIGLLIGAGIVMPKKTGQAIARVLGGIAAALGIGLATGVV
ncbi:MAG: HupE/UreJ family protein [Bauldia sp.]